MLASGVRLVLGLFAKHMVVILSLYSTTIRLYPNTIMASFSALDAAEALLSISSAAVNYDEVAKPPSSDEEESMVHRILNSFYNVDKDLKIHQLTNFTKTQFLDVFDMISAEMIARIFTGKGRRFHNSPIDIF